MNQNSDSQYGKQSFALTNSSEDCFVCTDKVILDIPNAQIKLPSTDVISEDEVVLICHTCLAKMSLPEPTYDMMEVYEYWEPYNIYLFHPDINN